MLVQQEVIQYANPVQVVLRPLDLAGPHLVRKYAQSGSMQVQQGLQSVPTVYLEHI